MALQSRTNRNTDARGRLVGPALLREIIRLHPVLRLEPTASSNTPPNNNNHRNSDAASPRARLGGGEVKIIACQVDDLRLQWIRQHLKQAACVRACARACVRE